MEKKVMIAMSGGVDSAGAAILLQKAGFSVSGVVFMVITSIAIEFIPMPSLVMIFVQMIIGGGVYLATSHLLKLDAYMCVRDMIVSIVKR